MGLENSWGKDPPAAALPQLMGLEKLPGQRPPQAKFPQGIRDLYEFAEHSLETLGSR